MEVNVGDEQMDSAGARSSETDRQDQRWSAYVTSSGRQDGDQARDVSAPIPSHQLEGQELWTRTSQSTSIDERTGVECANARRCPPPHGDGLERRCHDTIREKNITDMCLSIKIERLRPLSLPLLPI